MLPRNRSDIADIAYDFHIVLFCIYIVGAINRKGLRWRLSFCYVHVSRQYSRGMGQLTESEGRDVVATSLLVQASSLKNKLVASLFFLCDSRP